MSLKLGRTSWVQASRHPESQTPRVQAFRPCVQCVQCQLFGQIKDMRSLSLSKTENNFSLNPLTTKELKQLNSSFKK